MKRSLLVTLFVTFLPFNLISAEPSAFGAGDLNNPNPYGLTSSEETLLQNKKNLRKVVVKSNNQANEVDSLRERIDGLQTIIESLSRKAQENKIKIKKQDIKRDEELNSSDEYEKRLSEVTQINSQNIKINAQNIEINSQNIEEARSITNELAILLDSINSTYVTKKEFNKLVEDMNTFKDLVVKELKSNSTPKASKLSKMKTGDVATKAKQFYNKKYYTKAIEYYTYLIEKNYKPARAHYMIGVMNYKRNDYANAISYFKKSASLYSKASYMPSLMLYTAVSMDKTGDKKNARAFYNGVLKKYPNAPESKSAKKYLSLMK